MMRTIALVNQKGGVGKTTSAQNISAGLNKLGKNVLVVDLDPQANLTEGFGLTHDGLDKTIYDVIVDDTPLGDILIPITNGLDLAPSCTDLAGAEALLLQFLGKETRLKNALAKISGYDYIIIDAPPSLGQLTLNALTATQEIFIPLQVHFFAFSAIRKLLETVERVRELGNKNLVITGVIGTCFDGRKVLNKKVVDHIREQFGNRVFKTLIRDNINLAEAPATGKDIFAYKSSCSGAQDYLSLCREIVAMETSHV